MLSWRCSGRWSCQRRTIVSASIPGPGSPFSMGGSGTSAIWICTTGSSLGVSCLAAGHSRRAPQGFDRRAACLTRAALTVDRRASTGIVGPCAGPPSALAPRPSGSAFSYAVPAADARRSPSSTVSTNWGRRRPSCSARSYPCAGSKSNSTKRSRARSKTAREPSRARWLPSDAPRLPSAPRVSTWSSRSSPLPRRNTIKPSPSTVSARRRTRRRTARRPRSAASSACCSEVSQAP